MEGNLYLPIFCNLFLSNWRIIALRDCASFWQASTWISHGYTYIPSLLLPHSTPPGYHRVPGLSSLCHTANPGYLLNMVMGMFPSSSLSSSHPLFPPCVHKSVLHVCISTVVLQVSSNEMDGPEPIYTEWVPKEQSKYRILMHIYGLLKRWDYSSVLFAFSTSIDLVCNLE